MNVCDLNSVKVLFSENGPFLKEVLPWPFFGPRLKAKYLSHFSCGTGCVDGA